MLDENNYPIGGVIFDLFRTLTGIESEWPDLPVTSDALGIDRRVWDKILATRSRRRLMGAQRDPFEIVRTLAHEADLTIPSGRIREAVRIRRLWFRHALRSIPRENLDAIKHLRDAGLRLGLISNADVMEVAAWEQPPLVGLFDVELFSCEVGCVKPDPAIFRRCLDELKLTAGECLFVGDGGSNELIGAKEVGLRTVFVSGVIAEDWPERVRKSECTASTALRKAKRFTIELRWIALPLVTAQDHGPIDCTEAFCQGVEAWRAG